MFASDTALKLAVATLAGLILGFPYRARPGGIRAHLLVTLGAAHFCITALFVIREASGDPEEVLRVIQGVTAGIGFVGAASVLKKGGSIHGVSTAASIWIAAAVGCDVGLRGGYWTLVSAAAITTLSLLVGAVERHYFRKGPRVTRTKLD